MSTHLQYDSQCWASGKKLLDLQRREKKVARNQERDHAVEIDPEKKKMELVKIKIYTAPEMKNFLMGLTDYSLQKKGGNGKHPKNQAE